MKKYIFLKILIIFSCFIINFSLVNSFDYKILNDDPIIPDVDLIALANNFKDIVVNYI